MRERKGRGVVGLEIGLRYSAGSWAGIDRPGGDDVAFEEIEEAVEKTQIVLAYRNSNSVKVGTREDKKRWRGGSEKREDLHIGAQSRGGLANPSDSSDSDDEEESGTSAGNEYACIVARGVSSSSSSYAASRATRTRETRGCGCLPAGSHSGDTPSGLLGAASPFGESVASSDEGR